MLNAKKQELTPPMTSHGRGDILSPGKFHSTMYNEELALTRLKTLDRQTISEIYDQYFAEVYRYVMYRTGNAILAEDISSDVFTRLLETARNGKPPTTSLKGWLIATASHIVADQFRKKYRRGEETIPEELPDQTPEPADQVDQREQNRVVQKACQTLTSEQQEVISLRFGQGYSLEETAALMNKNTNAVKALQFRALAALNRKIGEVKS